MTSHIGVAEVLEIVDGDTFNTIIKVWPGIHLSPRKLGGSYGTIRLIHRDGKPFDAPDYPDKVGKEAAKRFAATLLPIGSLVIVGSSNVDAFGRSLAWVQLPDGRDMAQVMTEEGYIKKMTVTRKFDRVPSNDPRSINHLVRQLWTAPPPIVDKYWYDYAFLNQGPDGACVGFGISGELASEPESVPKIDYYFAMAMYREAQNIDEWPGTDYEGTSVLAGAKVAKNKGYYSEYLWALTEDDMARTVSNYGPVVIGVNWYENMMDPDSNGFLEPSGDYVGGHCVVVLGINATEGYYNIRNSWGREWGQNGEAKISRADMAVLISQNGDVCKPIRVSLNPEPQPEPEPQPKPVRCGFWEKLWNLLFGKGKWEC